MIAELFVYCQKQWNGIYECKSIVLSSHTQTRSWPIHAIICMLADSLLSCIAYRASVYLTCNLPLYRQKVSIAVNIEVRIQILHKRNVCQLSKHLPKCLFCKREIHIGILNSQKGCIPVAATK